MLLKSIAVLILISAGTTGAAVADTLVIEGIEAQGVSNSSPGRGVSQNSVQSRWGEAANKSAPVGEPPISSWEYDTFVVYFEYDHVIHSVAKR
jgi:hypothetical protein